MLTTVKLVPGTSVSAKRLHLQTGKLSGKLSDSRRASNDCGSRRNSLRIRLLLDRLPKHPARKDRQETRYGHVASRHCYSQQDQASASCLLQAAKPPAKRVKRSDHSPADSKPHVTSTVNRSTSKTPRKPGCKESKFDELVQRDCLQVCCNFICALSQAAIHTSICWHSCSTEMWLALMPVLCFAHGRARFASRYDAAGQWTAQYSSRASAPKAACKATGFQRQNQIQS